MTTSRNKHEESIEDILGNFSVAQYLEALRVERGIEKKTEWARSLNLTKQQYTNILNGSHKLSLDKSLEINEAIDGDETVMIKVWMDEQLHNANRDGSVVYVPAQKLASSY